MELGETLEETALREVFEETNIKIESLQKTNIISTYPIKPECRIYYGPEPSYVEEHIFFSLINSNPMLSNEHSEFGWYKYEEAIKILTFENNKQALESVERILEKTKTKSV